MSESDCVFCKIARGEMESEVVHELGVAESGYAFRINNGPDVGQEVFHLHAHVMGGKGRGMP